MDALLFMIFAAIAVICGINLVVQTHPISSALSLVGVMGALAALYLLLGGEFIAAAQLVVYAGAIMVLFVFVIMLLNAGTEKKMTVRPLGKYLGAPFLLLFFGMIAYMIQRILPASSPVVFGAFQGGTALEIGRSLFTVYLLPFEVTSVLILIAILGAIVLARKEVD
ncbi:MAG TPA: NADH-quinone oxidoreductase subunit J [Bryobacteraceae bacterium]|jgi:NADH-quinone oxidoreductase subunit J|nr:NADH-quinone oxidoreductase subunit J [Bryobacteraceae bacterium]